MIWAKEHTAFLLVALLLLFHVGVAYALVTESLQVTTSNTFVIVICVGVLGQAIGIGIWVGTTRSTIKFLKQSIETVGEKRDKDADKIGDLTSSVDRVETQQDILGRDLQLLKKVQGTCAWYNRSPGEFIKKNGG